MAEDKEKARRAQYDKRRWAKGAGYSRKQGESMSQYLDRIAKPYSNRGNAGQPQSSPAPAKRGAAAATSPTPGRKPPSTGAPAPRPGTVSGRTGPSSRPTPNRMAKTTPSPRPGTVGGRSGPTSRPTKGASSKAPTTSSKPGTKATRTQGSSGSSVGGPSASAPRRTPKPSAKRSSGSSGTSAQEMRGAPKKSKAIKEKTTHRVKDKHGSAVYKGKTKAQAGRIEKMLGRQGGRNK